MNLGKKDMRVVGVNEQDAENRIRRRRMIRCADPQKEQPKGK